MLRPLAVPFFCLVAACSKSAPPPDEGGVDASDEPSTTTFVNTLIAKKKAGLDVKVVLNKNFPTTGTDNTNVFNQLQVNGVSVVWAPAGFTYTHEKSVIVDGTSVWIMTMNVTFSSPTSNREYLALDTDPDDVAEAESVFQADFTNSVAAPSGKLLVAP